MNNKSRDSIKCVCLLCKAEVAERDVEAGFAVCASCRGYYFPEKSIYYRPEAESGPEIVITCKQQQPNRLARMADIDTWISKC